MFFYFFITDFARAAFHFLRLVFGNFLNCFGTVFETFAFIRSVVADRLFARADVNVGGLGLLRCEQHERR